MPDYGAPGVKIEEISSGPRPVSMAPTTETGMVGLLTLPEEFFLGRLRAPGLAVEWRPLMPLPRSSDAEGSWQAALAFLPFARPPEKKQSQSTSIVVKVDGQPRDKRELEDLLKSNADAKLFPAKDGPRDEKDALKGTRAIQRLTVSGDYLLEVKPGEIQQVKIVQVKGESPSTSTLDHAIRLADIVRDALGEDWELATRDSSETVEVTLRDRTEKSAGNRTLQLKVRRALLTLRSIDEATNRQEWVLAPRAEPSQLMESRHRILESIAHEAMKEGVSYRGDLVSMIEDSSTDSRLKFERLQEELLEPARQVTSIDSFETWQHELGERLFIALLKTMSGMAQRQAENTWRQLASPHQMAWARWVRYLPGMLQLEIAVRGYFTNGGRTADLAVAVQGERTPAPDKHKFLQQAFDSISSMAMVVAPGLDKAWQAAIHNYAGANGRGDLFAVLETPRFLLTRAEHESETLGSDRWMKSGNGYEQPVLEVRATTEETDLRYSGYNNDELLSAVVPRDDRGFGAAYGPWLIVDNPRSTGPHDRYLVAPPGGHIAGMIAATDNNPGGGVHKAPANEPMAGIHSLITTVSDTEQAVLNNRNINIIRRRPFAGIRCWGARTTAADPQWRYVNVRRLFLMVERSVRDATQWAVFRPNNDATRMDLKASIVGFLDRVHRTGALDGRTPAEAFRVRCDRENNPDADVRDGFLTVDVEIRPVFPAEFVRIRFRQIQMQTSISEGAA